MKRIIVVTGIIILCWTLIGCNHSVKNIKAQHFTISYGESFYESMNMVDSKTVDLLVNQFNEIELTGNTSEEINYKNAITIIFLNNDQMTGKITFDEKGICILNNGVENRVISDNSKFYETALEVFYDLEKKYKK